MKKAVIIMLHLLLLATLCPMAQAQDGAQGRNGKQPPTKGTFFMDVSTGSVTLQQTEHKKKYFADHDIGIAVSSWVPWEIRCTGGALIDENGNAAKGIHMFIQPARDPENPGKRYGGRNISMGGAKLVAKGQPVEQPVEVNRIRLGANLTRPVPPGVYRGELQFYMGPQGGVPVPGPSVQYSIEVKGYVELDVNPGPLEFVALAPGDVLSKNTVQIKAETNRRDMELQIALSPLQNVMDDGQVVPQSITSLGVSPQPRQAWRQAEHGRLGSYMLQVPLEPGKNTLHVAGRIRISLDIPAGEYRGNLNVTAQPAWR